MGNVLNNARARLVLHGQTRLEVQGRPVPIRRKGLGIIAVLGLSGSASRDLLASLLWENGAGRANLRVELHRLSDVVGRALFEPGADPLSLPAWVDVDVDSGDGSLFEGLEGLSFDFDRWIEEARSREQRVDLQNQRAVDIARQIASELRLPFLTVVRARPGEELDDLVRTIGETLRLPVVEGVGGSEKAVHTVSPPLSEDSVKEIVAAREGAWVVRVPAYGEDSREILELRSSYDPAKLRYVELPHVSWEDARRGLLHNLRFDKAAEAYVWTGGNGGFLRELAKMQWIREGDGVFAVPQRIRAAYQLEVRYASLKARLALERLSVHPGPITDSLIDALDARDALDELERRGWLIYEGTWRFREPESRTVLYRSVQPGRRASYHREVALQMSLEGDWLSESYHRLASGQQVTWSNDASHVPQGLVRDAVRAALGLDVDGSRPRYVQAEVGRELALLEAGRHGKGISGEGADWRLVKIPGRGPSAISFELPGSPLLVHLCGRFWAEAPLGIGVAGQALPLELQLGDDRRVVFLQGLAEAVARDEALLLPMSGNVDIWFMVSDAVEARIVTTAEAAVMEFEVTVHDVGAGRALSRNGRASDRLVEAVDLSSMQGKRAVGAGRKRPV